MESISDETPKVGAEDCDEDGEERGQDEGLCGGDGKGGSHEGRFGAIEPWASVYR